MLSSFFRNARPKTNKIILNKRKYHYRNYYNNIISKRLKFNDNKVNINNNKFVNSLTQNNIFNNKNMPVVKPSISNITSPIRCYSNTLPKPDNKQTYIPSPDPALPTRTTLVISTIDKIGSLGSLLDYFRDRNINITRIESRYSQNANEVIFFIDVDLPSYHEILRRTKTDLEASKQISSVDIVDNEKNRKVLPWFPITLQEVDSLALLVLQGGEDLEADHPGFNDTEYINRRGQIAKYAENFHFGDEIPIVKYSQQEIECWNTIWEKLSPLLPKHACDEYLEALTAINKHVGNYKYGAVPQLRDLSAFLMERTGFRLRPTAGLISSRHFLNGLAFKVFFCTQYIRHYSVPFYTPEPDVVHELVGHAPLFANDEFARFSQEIGLASIGATEDQIKELARCYWFSVEFGLCRKSPQSNERKAYGAGVLSSYGELQYAMSDEPEIRDWDPFAAAKQEYPITKYQPVYYLANSFDDAKDKMEEYAFSLNKPFSVRWDQKNGKLIVDANIIRGPRDMQDFGSYVGTAE